VPRVDSGLVAFTRHPEPEPPDGAGGDGLAWRREVFAVVDAAFAQRRKTLRNALKGHLTAAEITACGVDPGARAETLAPHSFNELARAVERRYGKAPGASFG